MGRKLGDGRYEGLSAQIIEEVRGTQLDDEKYLNLLRRLPETERMERLQLDLDASLTPRAALRGIDENEIRKIVVGLRVWRVRQIQYLIREAQRELEQRPITIP